MLRITINFSVVVGVFVLGTAAADDAVTVYLEPTNAVFQPNVAGETVTLTVSCSGGTYVQEEFRGTAPVSFNLRDEQGQIIEDDRCKYEVRIQPAVDEAAVKAAMDAGNDDLVEELDRAEQKQTVIVRGSLAIVSGTIVVPNVEPDADSSESHSHEQQ